MAQLMQLPLTVSCFSIIQIGFTFLVPAHLGSPGKGPLNGCVCVCVCVLKNTDESKTRAHIRFIYQFPPHSNGHFPRPGFASPPSSNCSSKEPLREK